MCSVAMTAGASFGLIETERNSPTASSWGTEMFRKAATAIQVRMIGIASVRNSRAIRPKCAVS
jgi:hypothetical protein